MEQAATNPNIKWAQRKDRLFITVDVVNVKNPVVDILDNKILKFQGTADGHNYAFSIELFDEVDKAESKYSFDGRNVFLNLTKKSKGPYWPRLTKDSSKLNWLKVDWNLYVDEDEEEESNRNLPNFGSEHGN